MSIEESQGRGSSRNGQPGRLVAYVTSHGFGHMNRTVAVLNRVPENVPVTIRSHENLFPNWRERLTRPAELEHYVSDVGTLHPPGESTATDGPATLELAARVHAQAMADVDAEAHHLREIGAAAVLCDAPPVPLVAAQHAGLPGFLMANFTWADIYAPHARRLGPEARELVANIRRAYRHAYAIFRIEPALKLGGLANVIEPGMVVNPVRERREELRRALALGPDIRLVYLYLGRYGAEGYDWSNLAAMAVRGIHFVGYHPSPNGPLPNLHVVSAGDWSGSELIASCDALVAKAGYGTVAEAMACETPMIYPPRRGFAEFRALDRALRLWGGGLPASSRDFRAFRIESQLQTAFQAKPGPPPFPADGATRIADHLVQICENGHETSRPGRL
jgi:hypothetical protein